MEKINIAYLKCKSDENRENDELCKVIPYLLNSHQKPTILAFWVYPWSSVQSRKSNYDTSVCNFITHPSSTVQCCQELDTEY